MENLNKKNVLVTGGAGFIGSNLVKLLLSCSFNVYLIDNLSTGSLENFDSNEIKSIHFIKEDLIHINSLRNLPQFDCCFHLAASVGRQKSIDFPVFDSTSNLISTIELLNFIVKNKVPKIIYSSSAAIYGELLVHVIDENHPLNSDSPYGVSKLAAEKMIFAYSNMYKFKAVALRYFNIFGINQRYDLYGNVIPIFVNQFKLKKAINIYGDGNQTRDFLDVNEVAKINLLSYQNKDFNGFYNLGSGNSITINTLINNLEKIFGYKIVKNFLPKRIGDVLHCKADINKIESELNTKIDSNFYSSLINYVNWYKSN
jgi:nucleoside-diphosphate-sugar epimerase